MSLQEYLNEKAIDLNIALENYLIQNGKVATGSTLRSIDIKIENDKIVVNLSPVFDFIDKGVNGVLVKRGSPYSFSGRFKMIPVSAITPWMRVKGIPETAKYAIAKAIYRDGIQGIGGTVAGLDFLFERFVNELTNDLETFYQKEIEDSIKIEFI
jgi:hypothetical protein